VVNLLGLRKGAGGGEAGDELERGIAALEAGQKIAGDEREEGGNVNGEAVRARLEEWGRNMLLRTVGWGFAWSMGMVGLWGDGFSLA
jgi:hypothetical protein